MKKDSDGEDCIYLNHYRCDTCIDPETGELIEWSDEWSCMCDDECPICGRDFSPYDSEDLSKDV